MPSESSIRVYNSTLNSLARDLGYDVQLLFPDGYEWLKDYKKVWKVIQMSTSLHTQNTKLFAVKYALELADAPLSYSAHYTKYISEVKEKLDAKYADNKKSQKEEANWLKVEDLENILEDLKKKLPRHINSMTDYKNVIKYLILKIHLETPLRNDLADAKIYLDPTKDEMKEMDENDDYNYIIVDSKDNKATFINNQFKTKKQFGQNKIDWSLDLAKDLKDYASEIIAYTDDHDFLVNNEKEKMNRNTYTKFMKTIFAPYGKDISTTMIRHIVVSDVYDLKEEEENQKKELAKNMGHTTYTARRIYAKV